MQKRTNPLELKVDAKDYTPAPIDPEKKTTSTQTEAAAAQSEKPVIHTAQPTESPAAPTHAAPPVPQTATPERAPSTPTPAPTAPQTEAEATQSNAVAEPAPKEPAKEQTQVAAEPKTEKVQQPDKPLAADRVAPVRPNRPAPPRPVRHNPAEDRIRHGEHVADNDVAVAVNFRLAGERVERRMVFARVSKDVCKLAQALYPEQSLSAIIEGALLTRAFLQDRDAFDATAREIIKKGGKIKC